MSTPVIDLNGNKFWYNSANQLHRENDLPAVEEVNGTKFWYVNGARCYSNKQFQAAAGLTDEEMCILILTYGDVK